MTRRRAVPPDHTLISGKVVPEAGKTDLKTMGKRFRRQLPSPTPVDPQIKPYRRPMERTRTSATTPGASSIVEGVKRRPVKADNPLQNVEVRDTFRLKRTESGLRLQRVSGHKRTLTRKRLRREGKL